MALFWGQVDSPVSPKTLEITEMTENFTKVTKYVTKLKGTSINYVWERSHLSFFMDSAFSNMIKNENPEMPEINRKLSKSKKHSVLTVYRY